jgi:hypothetical protein
MKARHKKAAGGSTDPIGHKVKDESPKMVYGGADSNVVKEARERKKGGKVMGKAAAKRADRKPRASGGCVSNPYSTAKNTSSPRPNMED